MRQRILKIGNKMLGKVSLQVKIAALLLALLAVGVIFNVTWSSHSQEMQAEAEMLEKVRILNQEMQAVWDFIEVNQKRIDTDANGEYNFKNIYCALAGKSVAALFMQKNDYEIRYVSEKPRARTGWPDDFEKDAYENFRAEGAYDGSGAEYYDVTTINGSQVFRYVSPIYIKESCLSCHGDPVGEIDVTGFEKEGLKVGDMAGAVSIIMPVDLYLKGIQDNVMTQSVMFFLIIGAAIVIVFAAVSILVNRLVRANHMLEEQGNELQDANEILRSEYEYKSEFFASMSHELRTPLTSILAFAEIVERSEEISRPDDIEALAEIQNNGYLLLSMVNNILEVARIDAGHVELVFEYVDMVDLIITVEGTVKPLAEKRSIELTTKVDQDVPLFYADWEKLRRIIENLTTNAIKFTQHNGQVSIHVSYDASKQEVVIVVRDTGIGIPEDQREHIFERYVQLDKSARKRYSGTGLGLSVVKEYVEAHQGRVELDGEYKKGSIFAVYIPVHDVPMQANEENYEDTIS